MDGQKSVLEGLYYIFEDISSSIYPNDARAKENRRKRLEIADEIQEKLSPEQSQLIEDYISSQSECIDDEVFKAYREGMYFGLRIMAESFLCREYDKE